MRLLFSALYIFTSVLCLAQTPLYEEDFESFDVGDYIGEESSIWTTWSGTTGTEEDGIISDDYSSSGAKSLKITVDLFSVIFSKRLLAPLKLAIAS